MPFFIAAGALIVGIGVLATGHSLLAKAERVQAAELQGAPAEREEEEAVAMADGSES